MMKFDVERVRDNVRRATSEDLLDRATVYRNGMEADALSIIEAELHARGITQEMIFKHAQKRSEAIQRSDGTAIRCSFCSKPAVRQGWGWHRLWRKIPIFPRLHSWCEDHFPF